MSAVGWALAVAVYTLAVFCAGALALAWAIVRCVKNVNCRTRSTLMRLLAGADEPVAEPEPPAEPNECAECDCCADGVSDEEDVTAGREMAEMHAAFGVHASMCCACQSGDRCEVVRRSLC